MELERRPRPGPALAQLAAEEHRFGGRHRFPHATRLGSRADAQPGRRIGVGETTPEHFPHRCNRRREELARSRALAHKACRDGYTVYYARAAQLFRELALAH